MCCDGLTGFPEAIAATWSQAAVQTCVAVKLLWLAIRNTEDKRAAERARERGQKRCRTAPEQLVEGQVVTNWNKALEQLTLVYPDRIEPYL